MNTPIDPREGNRRQKALRDRLAQMAAQGRKATVGRLGQQRGRVRSVGAIGGTRGARVAGNGMARPGALNFLQAPGFGLRARDIGRGPEMNPFGGPVGPRHVSNPLPSAPLPGGVRQPQAQGGPTGPVQFNPADNPGDPGYNAPDPMDTAGAGEIITAPEGRGAGFTSTAGALSGQNAGLIPLGGGQYLDPRSGLLYGVGGRILNGGGNVGGMNAKAL